MGVLNICHDVNFLEDALQKQMRNNVYLPYSKDNFYLFPVGIVKIADSLHHNYLGSKFQKCNLNLLAFHKIH